MTERRTIRRTAHELYPEPHDLYAEPLAEAVPRLYAAAIGLSTWGSDALEVAGSPDATHAAHAAVFARYERLVAARTIALLTDALAQGLSGEAAWGWVKGAEDETGELIYERAAHHGVQPYLIKPYPVLAEKANHWHKASTGNVLGEGAMTVIDTPESECEACTEEIPDPPQEEAAPPTPPSAPPCPECRAGKCRNCGGWTLDEASDLIVQCPCSHEETR